MRDNPCHCSPVPYFRQRGNEIGLRKALGATTAQAQIPGPRGAAGSDLLTIGAYGGGFSPAGDLTPSSSFRRSGAAGGTVTLWAHPNVGIRGNVDTRIGKVRAGECDAVVLARAGLARIGRLDEVSEVLDPLQLLPAPGQGALAAECRSDDPLTGLVAALDDPVSHAAVVAERTALATLEGGCSAPIGALADIAACPLVGYNPQQRGGQIIARIISDTDQVKTAVSAALRQMAATFGCADTSAHSASNRIALAANASGTKVRGVVRASAFELATTSRIEIAEVTMTIAGSVVTSSCTRYSASRVALPAMNCAVTTPEQAIASATGAAGN